MPRESPEPFRWYDAKLLLLKMKRFERAALKAEEFAGQTGLRAAYWRDKFRSQYREIIGIDPERRGELQRGLEAIVDLTDKLRSASDIIEEINIGERNSARNKCDRLVSETAQLAEGCCLS